MITLGRIRNLTTLSKLQHLTRMTWAMTWSNSKDLKTQLYPEVKMTTNAENMKLNLHQHFGRSIHTNPILMAERTNDEAQVKHGRKIEVSPNLTLVEAPDKKLNTQGNNPLVLFFPWLGATSGAIAKYCELYHQKGWDVLLVKSTAKHFLFPPNAKVLVAELGKYILSNEVEEERTDFIVHSMSIGAFIYTVFMIEIQEKVDKYQNFRSKLRGQIFDSIVIGGLKHMRKGVASSVTTNPLAGLSIRGLMSVYLFLSKKYTTDYYDYSVNFFHDHPMIVPTLLYYSLNDEFSDPDAITNLIGTWRAEHPRMDVTYKRWSKSTHTGHLRHHRQEYTTELTHFLVKIKIIDVHMKSNL